MAQTKFDKQVEETAEALAFGIVRFLARRAMDGNTRRTDASSSRSGRCVLPEVEGQGVPQLLPGRVAAPDLPHQLPERGWAG